MSWSNPWYILTHSKNVMREAIERDAKFLESNDVMDYSMLVGLSNSRKLLVLGIIGKLLLYIQYTYANIVKRINLD